MVIQRRKGMVNIGEIPLGKNHGFFQIDFYPTQQFENCVGHRVPKFYTDYPDNGVHKSCVVIFYISCNFENTGL